MSRRTGTTLGITLALLVMAAVAGWRVLVASQEQGQFLGGLFAPQQAQAQEVFAATSPRRTVTALGRIAPLKGIVELSPASVDILQKLLVQEGDWIAAEQPLAKLKSQQARSLQLELLKTKLEEAEAKLAAEIHYADSLIEEAKLGKQQALQQQDSEIRLQQAKVDLLESTLSQQKRDLSRAEQATDAVSAYQREQQRNLIRRTEEELQAAQEAVRRLRNLRAINEELAEAKLDTAQASKARLLANGSMKSLKQQIEIAREQAAQSTVTSPVEGRIIEILSRPGEAISPAKPLMKLADTSTMAVIAEVYESDIWHVSPGQAVTIHSEAFPILPETDESLELSGKVVAIRPAIQQNQVFSLNPAADVDLRVFEVKIALDDRSVRLPADFVFAYADPKKNLSYLTQHDIAARMIHLQVEVRFTPPATDGE